MQLQLLPKVAIAAMLAVLATLQTAAGHGMMTIPPARNWLAYVNTNYYYPDNNNAGGTQGIEGSFPS
jgi:predicted carbohydrate-binding protein with CBM5 and CBM33 domain